MRDLYACIKKLSTLAREAGIKGDALEVNAVEYAIARNFGGKMGELHRVLIAFHSQRLSVSDPHGLTQGMVEVEVSLVHLPGYSSGHLKLTCGELHRQAVVRRGAEIQYCEHGPACTIDSGVHPASEFGDCARPCDLIFPGDVLVAIQGHSKGPWDSSKGLWDENVDSPFEVRSRKLHVPHMSI